MPFFSAINFLILLERQAYSPQIKKFTHRNIKLVKNFSYLLEMMITSSISENFILNFNKSARYSALLNNQNFCQIKKDPFIFLNSLERWQSFKTNLHRGRVKHLLNSVYIKYTRNFIICYDAPRLLASNPLCLRLRAASLREGTAWALPNKVFTLTLR